MRKTAEGIEGVSSFHTGEEEEAQLASHCLLTVLKFQVLLKESLFLRLIVPWSAIPAASRQNMCVCERIPEHSPPKTSQTMSVQVGKSEREGGRENEAEI